MYSFTLQHVASSAYMAQYFLRVPEFCVVIVIASDDRQWGFFLNAS